MALPYDERIKWFREAKLGMFIHFGMYTVLGRGEQMMQRELIPIKEYDALAERFNPAPDWADRLARRAKDIGCKYIVLTARHHDGYCMFDTKTTDFNSVKTGPHRDLVAEYVSAARRAGLKVGIYYSVMNWRWKCFWEPDKYKEDLESMVREDHEQVEELMTNYGVIDVLWYDGSLVPRFKKGEGCSQDESWRFWRSEELNARVRELQPAILINNRSGSRSGEDFATPEQYINPTGSDRAWETCMTLNYRPGWSYLKYSVADKSAGEVLYNMLDAVRLGGNYLYNLGPDENGYVPERDEVVFGQLEAWMKKYGEAVYGTKPEGIYDLTRADGQGPSFHHGMFTCKGNVAYLSVFRYPGEEMVLSYLEPKVLSATLLADGRELEVERLSNGRTLLKGLPAEPPPPLAPVIKLTFEGAPRAAGIVNADWLDGNM